MEKADDGMAFNRKRAEGRDRGSKKNLQLKVRKLNPVSTICYVQILGTGMDTQDTSPSVLLFFDKQRFIFNAGEGLQRFCTEHKIKLSKIDHIFLSRVCSETAGGLPGLLLTLAGIGEEGMSVDVWGPSDLKYLVEAMRSFIPNAAMVHTHSFGETSDMDPTSVSNIDLPKPMDPIILVDDDVVRISAMLLYPRSVTNLTDGVNYTDGTNPRFTDPLKKANYIHFSRSAEQKTASALKAADVAVIYICELPEIKGKFDPSKAASFGLKPGPKYRELQLGNSVASDLLDMMVHPSDVLGPSSPGPIVLLVDCPTPSHLLELLSIPSLDNYYKKSEDCVHEDAKHVNCIIHLGPASVTKSANYQNWIRRFSDAKHIMAGHEMKNIEVPILRSSARISTRLNYVCPHLFPAPGFWTLQKTHNSHLEFTSGEDSSSIRECVSAENLLKFNLRPYAQLGLDRSLIPSLLTPRKIVKELLQEIPEIVEASKDVSKFWRDFGKSMHALPPKDENVIMVEEPWIDVNDSMLKAYSALLKPALSGKTGLGIIPKCLENISREVMEIVLLGTGSSHPSKYRNVSSIYINLFSKGSIILDCGEGTLAQLKRRFGVRGADNAVKSMKVIWISHIHADHHTGVARILALRSELLKGLRHEPLLVIGPRPLKRFLDAYSRLEDLDMQFLDCRHTMEASWAAFETSTKYSGDFSSESEDEEYAGSQMVIQKFQNTEFAKYNKMQSFWKRPGSPVDTYIVFPKLARLKEVLREAGLEALLSVPVLHCPQAFGFVLKAAERTNTVGKAIPGWKLVYSGDTRPCKAVIDASHDATVLIHEATFEDGMEAEAIARNHSTTMEAIGVGTSADAYRIILTHFSQRYPKIPVFDETHMDRTCIAFDMMSVNIADLPVLPKVLPYLKLLFKNEMAPDESDDVEPLYS